MKKGRVKKSLQKSEVLFESYKYRITHYSLVGRISLGKSFKNRKPYKYCVLNLAYAFFCHMYFLYSIIAPAAIIAKAPPSSGMAVPPPTGPPPPPPPGGFPGPCAYIERLHTRIMKSIEREYFKVLFIICNY